MIQDLLAQFARHRRLIAGLQPTTKRSDAVFSDAPYLGGTVAVGAIVAVLSILAPSGLGVREASMYALLLAIASPAVALGATVLNRLAITLVGAALLAAGVLLWRSRSA